MTCGHHFCFSEQRKREWSGEVGSGGPGLTWALVAGWVPWAGRFEAWYGGADQCGVFCRIVDSFESRCLEVRVGFEDELVFSWRVGLLS